MQLGHAPLWHNPTHPCARQGVLAHPRLTLLTAVQAGVAGLPGKPAWHGVQYEVTCCLQCMALAGLYIMTTSALDRVSCTAMLPGPIWLSLHALVPALKAGFVLWAFVSLFITTRKLQAQNLPAKLHLYR